MTRNNKHNEEELYRQFMDELEPGAREYDRMIEEGSTPAAYRSKARHTRLRCYVAAACIAGLLIMGGALYRWHTEHAPAVGHTAQTIAVKADKAHERKAATVDVKVTAQAVPTRQRTVDTPRAEDYICHLTTIVIPIRDNDTTGTIRQDVETAMNHGGYHNDMQNIFPRTDIDSMAVGGPSVTALYTMSFHGESNDN